LKDAVAKELAKILEPIRRYFETDREARESLEVVKKAEVTR
jgi:tyrosyl-tRNA synthetase